MLVVYPLYLAQLGQNLPKLHATLVMDAMDYWDLKEIHRAFRRHEEGIQGNMTSLFSMTSKFQENECNCTSHYATIMNQLVQRRQKMDVLEVECSMLRNMVINLGKNAQSTKSN
jgi:hypothetical protein